MNWKTAEAKQNLSKLLQHAADEPQRIYHRDRFVAAVISAELFEQFEQWRSQGKPTLGGAFSLVREIASDSNYELETLERRDRDSWITDR